MTNNSSLIMDCEFFPAWEWFNAFIKAEDVILEQYESFRKMSYHNRAYVLGPNGVICLSVPIQGGRNQRTIFKDVKISNEENWQQIHWKTIKSCYGRSAYFEYYEDLFAAFYHTKFNYLIDANLASLDVILQALQLSKDYKLTTVFKPNYDDGQINDCRFDFLPKHRTENEVPIYTQTFSDRKEFEPNLSMLDYIFCCGRWVH